MVRVKCVIVIERIGDLPAAAASIHGIQPSCMVEKQEDKAGLGGPRYVCIKSAPAGVGECSKDRSCVLVHDLTKIHGDCEQEDHKEQVNAK